MVYSIPHYLMKSWIILVAKRPIPLLMGFLGIIKSGLRWKITVKLPLLWNGGLSNIQ